MTMVIKVIVMVWKHLFRFHVLYMYHLQKLKELCVYSIVICLLNNLERNVLKINQLVKSITLFKESRVKCLIVISLLHLVIEICWTCGDFGIKGIVCISKKLK